MLLYLGATDPSDTAKAVSAHRNGTDTVLPSTRSTPGVRRVWPPHSARETDAPDPPTGVGVDAGERTSPPARRSAASTGRAGPGPPPAPDGSPAREGPAPRAAVTLNPDALEATVDHISRRLRNPLARSLRIGWATPGPGLGGCFRLDRVRCGVRHRSRSPHTGIVDRCGSAWPLRR
jgi:hypothetical protein